MSESDFQIPSKWNQPAYQLLKDYLLHIQDIKFRNFHQKLVPDVTNLIGIRVPELRKIAKKIAKGNMKEYFNYCGSQYYEEVMLHGLVIGSIPCHTEKDKNFIFASLCDFIPQIDNWAVCDTFCAGLKFVKSNKDFMHDFLIAQANETDEFRVRFALATLLFYYIEETYLNEILTLCDTIKSDYYYVNMAIAWLLSICFVKFPKKVMPYLEQNHLDKFTYQKTLQKITESNQADAEMKMIIRQMKKG